MSHSNVDNVHCSIKLIIKIYIKCVITEHCQNQYLDTFNNCIPKYIVKYR